VVGSYRRTGSGALGGMEVGWEKGDHGTQSFTGKTVPEKCLRQPDAATEKGQRPGKRYTKTPKPNGKRRGEENQASQET